MTTVLVVAISEVEVVLSGLLTVGCAMDFGLSFGMVAGFTLGLVTLLSGETVATCECFGAFSLSLSLEATILRNLVVLVHVLVSFLLCDIDCS